MKILAFSGKKQCGKSTAINDLDLRIESLTVNVNFADKLKQIVAECFFGQTYFKEEMKEQVVCGKTGREWLQIVGTDWFRKANPDCWVNAFKATIQEYEYVASQEITYLVSDVRFPNEAKAIQDLGGHVIRLTRKPFDDKHESETALDDMPLKQGGTCCYFSPDEAIRILKDERRSNYSGFDAIIDNSAMSIDQQNETIWKLVTEKQWI
jgi:hypothetical protein